MEATPNKSTTAQDGWDGAANFAWTSPDDDFEVWLAERLDFKLSDPSFEVRRALPADFDAIFDLVDVTFGTRRPRAQYHWLYQDNPLGLAHCWLLIHRERRRLVGATAYWPWPLALGSEVLPGVLGGDGVIATEWQRQGAFNLIREGFRSHSEYERRAMVSWPNVKNQGRQKKHGRSFRVIGPLPQARWNLRRGLLDRLTPQRRPETVAIDRFDSTFDTLTWRWMGSDGFWSPHDSEFLNWRYLRHPVREYGAFAVLGPKGDAIGTASSGSTETRPIS